MEMFARTKELSGLKYTMLKKERIGTELLTAKSTVKLCLSPFKVYSKQLSPDEGLEILYCEGRYNNKVLVNPNGFPWFTLKMNARGNLIRANQHHTVLHSGYDYVVSILEFLFEKYKDVIQRKLTYQGRVNWQGHECHSIRFANVDFKYINYTVKEGETLSSICDRWKLSEYMVLQKNPSIDDFNDELDAGQVIVIPNDYSPRMIIYIDTQRMIPLMMKIFDDEGIYEIYEYYDVVVNPEFSEIEFSEDNDEYDF